MLTRLSFRSRLALTITAVFITAGVALMAVEYLLVSNLFTHAVQTVAMTVAAEPAEAYTSDSVPPFLLTQTTPGPAGSAVDLSIASTDLGGQAGITSDLSAGIQAGTIFVNQSTVVGDEVLTGLLVWSGIALVVFAGLAAVAASWLARRSMRRIGEVTAMAKEVSTTDLHRRLDLPGPTDEIKELADTIDQMLERLESAFASQDRFVANASHELRTPLTTTRTALEIPLAQGRVPAELQPAFRVALKAGEHSEKLISALLHLSRGVDPTHRDSVDLVDIADAAVEAVEPSAVVGDVAITVQTVGAGDGDREPRTLLAQGDSTMLLQAVTNVLDNAVRHNEPGGCVRVELAGDSESVVVTVENSGKIIDPETVDLLCEPFYRADQTRMSGSRSSLGTGVGLGLSIVSSVVKAHAGALEISARPEGGLRVRLSIPRGIKGDAAAQVSREAAAIREVPGLVPGRPRVDI